VVLWDMSVGKQRSRWNAHDTFVRRMAFSPDCSRLATGGADG